MSERSYSLRDDLYVFLKCILTVKAMCLCMCLINVCRWVKWTSTDIYSDQSLMSTSLFTCLWLMMTTCWSRTSSIIAFWCLTLNDSYNASSLTTSTLNSSCGGQHDYVTVQTRQGCMFYTAAVSRRGGLTRSLCSVCVKWVTHDCSTMTYSINLSLIHHRVALFHNYTLILHWNHINDRQTYRKTDRQTVTEQHSLTDSLTHEHIHLSTH